MAALGAMAYGMSQLPWNKKQPSKTINTRSATTNNISNVNSQNAYGTAPMLSGPTQARSSLLGG
jgi:hypothetical protein